MKAFLWSFLFCLTSCAWADNLRHLKEGVPADRECIKKGGRCDQSRDCCDPFQCLDTGTVRTCGISPNNNDDEGDRLLVVDCLEAGDPCSGQALDCCEGLVCNKVSEPGQPWNQAERCHPVHPGPGGHDRRFLQCISQDMPCIHRRDECCEGLKCKKVSDEGRPWNQSWKCQPSPPK